MRQMAGTFEILPANLLPLKAKWKAISGRLPQGSALVILPATNGSPRRILETVATILKADGHKVITLLSEEFL